MKGLIFILVALLTLCFVGPAFATPPQPPASQIDLDDLEGLTSAARNQFIEHKLKRLRQSRKAVEPKDIIERIAPIADPDVAERWGDVISKTIKTISSDLAIGVNEFIKTDVGKITLFIIAYKILGEDIKDIFFGSIAWVLVTIMLLFSFRHFHMSEKTKVKDDKSNVTSITYTPRYTWTVDSDDECPAKVMSAIFHVVGFAAITIISLAIICT